MKQQLTPKQVARAIGVSESSVKRWCDKGVIQTQCTEGGHRRILMSDFLAFVRAGKHDLVRPEVAGLPATSGQSSRVVDRASDHLLTALLEGDEERCRRITLDLYLAQRRIVSICDDVYAPAFLEIGDRWECGDAHVYQERRSCEIALRVFYELRGLLPPPSIKAPLAIGGAGPGDQYHLATTMVELVLREAGWNAVSLGANLPLETLAIAIETHQPRLFWLSCSHLADESQFLRDYASIQKRLGGQTSIVVGGRAITPKLRRKIRCAAHCDSMADLQSFAKTL